MGARKVFTYEGKEQVVSWDGRLCIHVGECGRAKGELFVNGRKPWCDPDLAGRDEAADVVARCPSGALALHEADGTLIDEAAAEKNSIHIINDGPLYVSGDLAIDGAAEDMLRVNRRAALCRCGKSNNKPFCDNSHREAGFEDAGAVGEKGLVLDEEGGPVTVNPIPDGPLQLAGNLTMYAGTGRPAWQGRKVFLCRCGESKNKPFCDGSHKAAGFKTSS